MKSGMTMAVLATSALALVFLIAYTTYLQPRLELAHRRMINRRLERSRDQAQGNPTNPQALNSMIQALHSKDPFEQTAAAAYIGQLGKLGKPAVDALIEALNGANLYAAREAAVSLGKIGPGAARAIPSLTNAVRQHANADIGWFSAESLGRVANPNDQTTISVLQEAAKSPDDRMRKSAVSALRCLESRRAENPSGEGS